MLYQYIFRFWELNPRLSIRPFGEVKILVVAIGHQQDKLCLFWILLTTLGREFLVCIILNLMIIGHIVKQKVTLYFGTIKQTQVINIITKTQLTIGLLFNKKLSTNIQFHFCLIDYQQKDNLWLQIDTNLKLKSRQTMMMYQKLCNQLQMLGYPHSNNNQVKYHQKYLLLFVFYKDA